MVDDRLAASPRGAGELGDLAAVLAIQPSAVASKRLFDGMDGYSGTDMEEQPCYGDNG